MPTDGSTDIRCPDCGKKRHIVSADFVGAIWFHCYRCKQHYPYPSDAATDELPRIECPLCIKLVGFATVEAGVLRSACNRCKGIVVLTPEGLSLVPRDSETPIRPPQKRKRGGKNHRLISPAERDATFVALLEDRWSAMRVDQARVRAYGAIGIRFAVFNRDGFRCRYCGRSVNDGAILEADHVVPRSQGGPDTMENLVTACRECNRGKSDRGVDKALLDRVV